MNELNGRVRAFEHPEHRWRLVVADDISLNADCLSDVLRLMGHDVVTAYNGLEAIAAHETFRPDAYVLDLGMPVMDGYATCRAIRNRPGGDAVAIVALSGWGRHDDLAQSLEAGFSSFLVKPAHPGDIIRCLSGLWSKRVPPDRFFTDRQMN
jgi:CheY-like chemotaxis protein